MQVNTGSEIAAIFQLLSSTDKVIGIFTFLCYNIFIINRTTSQGYKVNIVNIKENADGFIG